MDKAELQWFVSVFSKNLWAVLGVLQCTVRIVIGEPGANQKDEFEGSLYELYPVTTLRGHW